MSRGIPGGPAMLNRKIVAACGWLAAMAVVVSGAGAAWAELPVGEWEAKYTVQEQEVEATITVTKGADGKLGGKWVSPFGESELENAKYENGRLTFTRHIAFGDNELVLDFDGTIEGDTLTGKIIGENIEADVTAKLKGGVPAAAKASLVGVWDVRYQGSQGGERRSTITINADMTGKVEYANRDQAIALESATQSGEDVTYRYTVQFNNNPFQVNFVGKIAGNELAGKYVNAEGNEFADVKATRRAGFALRINAGGRTWTDGAGREWKADQAYTEGGWGYVGGETVDRTGIAIAGTDVADMYQTERYSLEAYRLPACSRMELAPVPAGGMDGLTIQNRERIFFF